MVAWNAAMLQSEKHYEGGHLLHGPRGAVAGVLQL